jgi:ceramide glucosyltransferase
MQGWTFAALVCSIMIIANLASIALAGLRLRRRISLPAPAEPAMPVTIVRPLCGIEEHIEATLASGFRLDYPRYELIFCVAAAGDPVIPIVRRLMEAHPAVPSRLLVGDVGISANPKLNNCVKDWEAARHDWVVLADSNVLMPRDYIQQLRAAWRHDTGLVCSTPIGSHPDGIWAEVECAFLNNLQARWQYAGEALGFGFGQGKSMLWHRPFLEEHGGIRALAAEIAEDAAATKLMRGAGRRVHLVDAPFEQPLGRRTLREIWRRQIRWARLRRVTFSLFFAPELLTTAIIPVVFGVCAAAAGEFDLAFATALLVTLWYGAELALSAAKGWWLSPRLMLAFLIRDGLIPLIWIAGWIHAKTVWRGNRMQIESDGAELVSEAARA